MSDREIGIFPPADEWDVAAYPTDDVVDGYHSHSMDDCEPGNNQTNGFRWGGRMQGGICRMFPMAMNRSDTLIFV